MIDWHCHILPGLDDGAASLDEAVAMARLLAGAGYTHICCTPHRLRGMYDTAPETMRQSLGALQAELDRSGIPLKLVPGMEYCLDEFFVEDFSHEPVTLGGTARVLVETPANADPQLLRENIFHLVRNGYLPLFAHPERHAFLAPPPASSGSLFARLGSRLAGRPDDGDGGLDGTLLADLQQMGCVFQGNLGSIGGYYGSLVKDQEERLRSANFLACYGSDGHDVAGLEMFLDRSLAVLGAEAPALLATDHDLIVS